MSHRSKQSTTARRCKARGHLYFAQKGERGVRCPYCGSKPGGEHKK